MLKGKNVREGTEMLVERDGVALRALVLSRDSVNGQFASVSFSWKNTNASGSASDNSKEEKGGLTFGEVLQLFGSIPLPPYMKRKAVERDADSYQTVYSSVPGSVAAPTAGLHFTDGLVENLVRDRGIHFEKVTLHTGPGTFVPLQSEDVGKHHMHTERFSITKDALRSFHTYLRSDGDSEKKGPKSDTPSGLGGSEMEKGRRRANVVAVGTTTVRSLETVYWLGVLLLLRDESQPKKLQLTLGQWQPYHIVRDSYQNDWSRLPTSRASFGALLEYLEKHRMEELMGTTSIMIMPGYRYRVVNQLITNFHAPKTTLMLLVASFAAKQTDDAAAAADGDGSSIDLGRRKVLMAYEQAVKHNFRFLSYGDACFFARFSDLPPSFMDATSPLQARDN
jgi:S-adenosylmethionine:tRNA ribosyltransferase-isomerase